MGNHYIYIYYWLVFQSSVNLVNGSKNYRDEYIFFHNAYGTNTAAYIRDAKVSLKSIDNPGDYATLTCPPKTVFLAESTIPDAGLGAFVARFIPEGSYFGPYLGTRTNKTLSGGSYAWTVYNDLGEFIYYIDGFDTRISNWLRFVNCPDFAYQQNLVPIQYDGEVYYQAIRDIQVDEELFVYYGNNYASCLGIDTNQLFEYTESVPKLMNVK